MIFAMAGRCRAIGSGFVAARSEFAYFCADFRADGGREARRWASVLALIRLYGSRQGAKSPASRPQPPVAQQETTGKTHEPVRHHHRALFGAKSELETSTIRAISWRLIPFLVLAYFLSYLDRVNLGFAALTMNAELNFSPTVFAWGAGIFFIGYFLFEVPSNLALEKFGASRWIARIMVTWGIISALMALVSGVGAFTACASCSASPRPASFPASSCI